MDAIELQRLKDYSESKALYSDDLADYFDSDWRRSFMVTEPTIDWVGSGRDDFEWFRELKREGLVSKNGRPWSGPMEWHNEDNEDLEAERL